VLALLTAFAMEYEVVEDMDAVVPKSPNFKLAPIVSVNDCDHVSVVVIDLLWVTPYVVTNFIGADTDGLLLPWPSTRTQLPTGPYNISNGLNSQYLVSLFVTTPLPKYS